MEFEVLLPLLPNIGFLGGDTVQSGKQFPTLHRTVVPHFQGQMIALLKLPDCEGRSNINIGNYSPNDTMSHV